MQTITDKLADALRALRDEVERVGLNRGGIANGARLAAEASTVLVEYDAQPRDLLDRMADALGDLLDAGRFDNDGNFIIAAGQWDGKGDPPDVCDPPAITAVQDVLADYNVTR